MRLLLALLVLMAALAAPARADEDVETRARAHYEIALGQFRLGNYRGALKEFKAGYELARKPGFLLNIALSNRKLGRRGAARDAYRQYLAEAPADDPQRAEVEQLIGELEGELRTQPDVAAPPEPEAEPTTLPNAPPRLIAIAPPPRHQDRPRLRIAGLAIGAAGIAVVGVGIGFAVLADSTARDLNRISASGGAFDPDKDSAYHTDRIVEIATLSVGGAAVATGLVLYLVGRR